MLRVKVAVGMVVASGCFLAGEARAADGEKARRDGSTFTLGLVQRELKAGLSQAEVVERLGSPNILTRAGDGREAWVYDRVAREVEASGSGINVGGGLLGGWTSVAGVLGVSGGARKEKTRSSQRTLTVVVRFSADGAVESYTWHDSRF